MKIGVGICNFNQAELVGLAVTAVLDQGADVRQVLVVDNASTDASLEVLGAVEDPRLRVIELDENLGGAGGFHHASRTLLAEADLEALALVDSDCLVDPDCLEILGRRLEQGADIAGPVVFYADRRDVVQEAGGRVDWSHGRLLHRHRGYNETDAGRIGGSAEVDFVASCALLARREVFECIGHFDPEYFIYFDDVDWCARAAQAGFMTVADADARALHHGGSRRKGSHLPTYYAWRNRVRFFVDHSRDARSMRYTLLDDVARAAATCRCWGQERCAEVILKATLDGLAGLSGRCPIPGSGLVIDSVSPPQVSPCPGESVVEVEHIFEADPPGPEGDPIIRDRYGKIARWNVVESLRPRFSAERADILRSLRSQIE